MAGPGSEVGWKNLELGRWKPGQSGNPRGRRKGLVTLLREKMAERTNCDRPMPNGRTVEETLAELIIDHAMNGNAAYFNQLIDRLEGKIGAATEEDRQQAANSIVVELPVKELHPEDQIADAHSESEAAT